LNIRSRQSSAGPSKTHYSLYGYYINLPDPPDTYTSYTTCQSTKIIIAALSMPSISKMQGREVITFLLLLGMCLFFIFSITVNTIKPALMGINVKVKMENRRPSLCDLSGLRVLAINVHFEGNLGDEMETTPLFHFLRQCNAHVTAQLSDWLRGKLDPNSSRNAALVDKILLPSDKVNRSDFDVVISAPGPTLNNKSPDIVFGASIRPYQIQEIRKLINPSAKLIVTREPLSYERLQGKVSNTTKLFMGADLSFSFPFSEALLNYWDRHFRQKGYAGSTLVFSRKNNFGKNGGVSITSNNSNSTVHLKVGESHEYGRSEFKTFPLSQIIFASSSAVEDASHFQTLSEKYDSANTSGKSRFIVCEQVEQLWALVNMSQFVFTDRYHPGVAARIHDIPLKTIAYKGEQYKLSGLMKLSNVTVSEMKAMNQEAFQLLSSVLMKYRKV